MIIIPFVPGAFGSTVEYVIRKFTNFSNNDQIPDRYPLADGSMHSFKKNMHITDSKKLEDAIIKYKNTNTIITPIYPFEDLQSRETFDIIEKWRGEEDKVVAITIENKEMAEINILFQYYKICVGLNVGLNIFFGNDSLKKKYGKWAEAEQPDTWKQRYWFSMFYPKQINEWIETKNFLLSNQYVVSNFKLLFDTKNTLNNIFSYCNCTNIQQDKLELFINDWRSKQQYILDEYQQINEFVDSVIKNKSQYMNHSSIIAESIIQHKLRENGFKIKCLNLNTFPTQAQELHKLLEII